MKKLEKKTIEKSDGKTYFAFSKENAEFVRKIKSEFGLSNSELGDYCIQLLKIVVKYPQIVDYINDLESKK